MTHFPPQNSTLIFAQSCLDIGVHFTCDLSISLQSITFDQAARKQHNDRVHPQPEA